MVVDAEGKEIEVTEDNAAEIARKEMEQENIENETPEEKTGRLAKEEVGNKEEEDKVKAEDELIAKEDDTLSDDEKAQKAVIVADRESKREKTDEEILGAKDEDLNEDQKAKKTVLVEAQATERTRLLDAKEEDLNDKDKEAKKTVLLQIESEEKDTFDVKVADFAKEKDIPVEEARSTLESVTSISKKYENNPEKIAEANLGLQRLVSKKDEEILAIKDEASQPRRPQSAKEWENVISENGLVTSAGKHQTAEMVIEAYRAANEDTTEGMEDEQVLKLISKEIHVKSDAFFEKEKGELKTLATEKRDKLLASLPEGEKQYSEDLKELLKSIPDSAILNENFDMEHSMNWVRGKNLTPEKIAGLLKEAELKGFTRGQAKGKIVTGPIDKGNIPPQNKPKQTATPKQIDEAWLMFPGALDEAEAVASYLEVQGSRPKNKKKKE